MDIITLMQQFQSWGKDVITDGHRLKNEEAGYAWAYKSIAYNKTLTTADYITFFDRTSQNDNYVERYNNPDTSSKLPYSYIQTEIDMIASFHKCFAMRNMSRLQYYRNDMSQKGARAYSATNMALGNYLYHAEHQENP